MVNRTYVRWKYTFMFVWAFYISIYNKHMFERRYTYTIFAPPFFFSFLSIILYLYTKMRTLFPAPYLSRHFLTFTLIYSLLYTLYIERSILSRNFLPLSHTFIILLIYIEWYTLCPPLFTPYKVNTFSTATFLTFLIVWEKVCGEKFLKTLLV